VNQDPVFLGGIAESQSLNRFAFVEGQTVGAVDPFGLCPWCIYAGYVGIVAAITGSEIYTAPPVFAPNEQQAKNPQFFEDAYTDQQRREFNAAVVGIVAGGVGLAGKFLPNVLKSVAKSPSSSVEILALPAAGQTSGTRKFPTAVEHFEKHALPKSDGYNVKNYIDDANSVINNGLYSSKFNAFVKPLTNGKNFEFVGLNRNNGNITTLHIKGFDQLLKKDPELFRCNIR